MTDVMTPEQRSRCMAHNKGKDTGPEIRLRRALWAAGLRYRLKSKLSGKPDIVFPKAKVAVFVDGCFWHGCPLHFQQPVNNAEFWKQKIGNNRERDARLTDELTHAGWVVLRLWEHEVTHDLTACVERIAATIRQRGGKQYPAV